MIEDLRQSLEKVAAHFTSECAQFHSGAASSALLESISVEAYGAAAPLKNNASISVLDPKTLKVEPWDASLLPEIEKQIQNANLGFNPQNMGTHLLVPIPQPTEETRMAKIKLLRASLENAKISVRSVRQDFFKKIKAQKDASEISEDAFAALEKDFQKEVESATQKLSEIAAEKEAALSKF